MFYFRKAAISTAFLALALICTSAFPFSLGKDSKGNFLSWDINSIPIRYWIHLENPTDETALPKFHAVVRAFESWEAKMLSLVSFKYAGLTDVNKAAFDGINLVTWITSNWQYNSDTVAYTTLWITENGRILDADIELNAEYFEWSATGEKDKMDIHNVLTHEAGHFIGIEHSIESTNLSMFPIVTAGEVRKRIVKPDDISAASFLYPVNSATLEIFDLPSENLMNELIFSERLNSNYSDLISKSNISKVTGIKINSRADAGIAALSFNTGGFILQTFPKPGKHDEEISATAKDYFSTPDIFIKDITSLDIDGDEVEEVAVLGVDTLSNHAVLIYDSPLEGTFGSDNPKEWIARDLWRIPDSNDNLMIFSLDIDGDGQSELATLSYAMDGIYLIKSYAPPLRYDNSAENALSRGDAMRIPFTIAGSILDIDSLDIDSDGVSELVILIKGDFGYTVQVLRISIPAFADEVQEFKVIMTMSLILEKDEHPVALSVISGYDMKRPEILLTIAKTNR